MGLLNALRFRGMGPASDVEMSMGMDRMGNHAAPNPPMPPVMTPGGGFGGGLPPAMSGAAGGQNPLLSAFSGAPQFQQQLQAIMGGQGPGRQAPQFTPPQTPMSPAPAANPQAGGGGMSALQQAMLRGLVRAS